MQSDFEPDSFTIFFVDVDLRVFSDSLFTVLNHDKEQSTDYEGERTPFRFYAETNFSGDQGQPVCIRTELDLQMHWALTAMILTGRDGVDVERVLKAEFP